MSDITVHGIPGSPYVRAVLLGLEEKAAPYAFVRMAPMESKQPAHLARHPFGRIPSFAHGDFALYETQAILRYIDAVFPDISLRPAEPRAAAIPKAEICCAEVNRLLGHKAYMACDRLTIADLMLAPHMEFLSITPEGTPLLAPSKF